MSARILISIPHITRSSRVRGNRGLSNGPASSYVKKTPHKAIYGHKNKVYLEQNISIGSDCME